MPVFIKDPVIPPPQPPEWWPLLTTAMRKTVLTRLRVKGLDVSAWPR